MEVRADLGRAAISGDDADRGKFLTPGLRNLRYTSPYMHNGVLRSLQEVVEFYDQGGGPGSELLPLHLTAAEKQDLQSFLESLSGPLLDVRPPVQPQMRILHAENPWTGILDGGNQVADTCCRSTQPLGPLPPVPGSAADPLSGEMAALGRLLFWDPRVSGDGSTPCVSCHFPTSGWSDVTAIARGYPGTQQLRNAGTIINSAHYQQFLFDGAFDSLEATVRAAGTSSLGNNVDEAMVEMRLRFVPEYVYRFKNVFGTEWPEIADVWKSIAAFVRTIVSNPDDVPFDRYMSGDSDALSKEARRGLDLFLGKAGCIRCHDGPLASDQQFYDVGLEPSWILESRVLHQVTHSFIKKARGMTDPAVIGSDVDLGRFYKSRAGSDAGRFRAPSLRELKYTEPYMHDGRFRTLDEVVDFFDRGGGPSPGKSALLQPLRLTESEKRDLVRFLESLSSDVPPLSAEPPIPPLQSLVNPNHPE
jgi:cytochrome c peroxidase